MISQLESLSYVVSVSFYLFSTDINHTSNSLYIFWIPSILGSLDRCLVSIKCLIFCLYFCSHITIQYFIKIITLTFDYISNFYAQSHITILFIKMKQSPISIKLSFRLKINLVKYSTIDFLKLAKILLNRKFNFQTELSYYAPVSRNLRHND